jgi:PAS domain S-box-containing protein
VTNTESSNKQPVNSVVDDDVREAAEHFRLISEISPDGLTIMKQNEIVFVNDRLCEITGYSRQELSTLSTLDMAVPEDAARLHDFINHSRSNCIGPDQLEFSILRKDGQRRHIRNRYSPIRQGDRSATCFVLTTDLTERVRAQKALQESDQRYRTLFESAYDAIFVMDGEHFIDCNRMTLKMFGCTREQIIGAPPYRYSPPKQPDGRDSLEKAREKISAAFSGKPQFFEWLHCQHDGTLFDAEVSLNRFDLSGKSYLLAVVRDITERKRAEKELKESERRFKDLANLLPACVCEIDTEGKFTYVNRQSFEFTGYSQEDVDRGLTAMDLIVPEDRERLARNFKRVLMGNRHNGAEYRVLKKDGSVANVIIYSNSIKHDGKPVGLRGIVVDITDKKRLEEFATRAQRLETAGRIAGQVAHDFNNLLGPLMAYPELISGMLPQDHQAHKYLNDMDLAASKMSEINQQLLTLGRRGHYNQHPQNLNDILRQVINQMKSVPQTLTVETELAPDLMTVNGGEAQLFRAISNLVSNARDAVGDHGRLTISTENIYVDKPFGYLEKIPRGEYVRLTVADSGDGIPATILPLMFDPFFTTKRTDRKRGSGLGLSIVHAVMEDHNGHIDCETETGTGTRFHLYFPASREIVRSVSEEAIVGGTESVLVVDDDQTQRGVTQNLLDNLGYQVTLAANGEEALELMRSGTFDLLVLDMIMPDGIDGAETYEKALEIRPGQKAIVVSGYAESNRIQVAQELGAKVFVRKPVTLRSLAKAVRMELDQKTTITSAR